MAFGKRPRCLGLLLLAVSPGARLCVWQVLDATKMNKQRKMIYVQKSLRERSLIRTCRINFRTR